jgi:hypothetical protein
MPIVAPTSTFTVGWDAPSVPSLAPPAELLRALSAALGRLGAGWYVFGAQAVVYWGRPRLTEDVDVTVQLGRIPIARLVAALEEAGFTLRVEGTRAFIDKTRVLPLLHVATGWPLDIVIGGPGLEERFLDRAVAVEIAPDVTIRMISAEDLVVTKVLAGRPKDIEDVRGILAAQNATFGVDAVRRTLGELEAALGVSDLRPVFERLYGSASRSRNES